MVCSQQVHSLLGRRKILRLYWGGLRIKPAYYCCCTLRMSARETQNFASLPVHAVTTETWYWHHILTLSVCVPAPYSFAAVSPGSVTDAVAPSGMVNVHFHMSPSYLHELFISPAAERYSALR